MVQKNKNYQNFDISYDSATDYRDHKKLVDAVSSAEAETSKRNGLGKIAPRYVEKLARDNLNMHADGIEKAYRLGSLALDIAHEDAIQENNDHEYNSAIATWSDELSAKIMKSKSEKNFQDLNSFGKIDFIYNLAHTLNTAQELPFINVAKDTVTIFGNFIDERPRFLPRHWGGHDMYTVPAIMKINKNSSDAIEIDFYKLDKVDYKDPHIKHVDFMDRIDLVNAIYDGSWDKVRRNGLSSVIRNTVTKTTSLSETSENQPFAKLLLNSNNQNAALVYSPTSGMPEGTKIYTSKGVNEVIPGVEDYREVSFRDGFIDTLCAGALHGVFALTK